MKITTFFSLNRVKNLKLCLLGIVCLLLMITNVVSECNIKYGCLARQKFMSYVTVQGKDGEPLPLRTILNYKVLYIFTDRIVFYTSSDSGSPSLEADDTTDQVDKIESKMERVINYGDILLDCGKYNNKLCHAQEYPQIDKNQSFKKIQETIRNNADVFCLVLPFFENGYQKVHEKMAYICAMTPKDLYNIITFKNYLSRKIELYQLKVSGDRFNGFNGLLKRRSKFITIIDGKTVPVIGRIYNRGISLTANDETRRFLKNYSFYQQREHKNGCFLVSDGLAKNKIPPNWANGMNPEPSPECCLYFKGETENMVLCQASADGKSVESASDICQIKMKSYFKDVFNSLRGIKFSEAYHELSHNKKKLETCKSAEYKILKWRAEKTIDYAVNVDCKFIMNYVNSDEYQQKLLFCRKNYSDELKLELKLMSLDNDTIYDGINRCVYQAPDFKKIFDEKHFFGK